MSLWEKQQRSAGAWAGELPHGERSHVRGMQGGVRVSGGWLSSPPMCNSLGLLRRDVGRGMQTACAGGEPGPRQSQQLFQKAIGTCVDWGVCLCPQDGQDPRLSHAWGEPMGECLCSELLPRRVPLCCRALSVAGGVPGGKGVDLF